MTVYIEKDPTIGGALKSIRDKIASLEHKRARIDLSTIEGKTELCNLDVEIVRLNTLAEQRRIAIMRGSR